MSENYSKNYETLLIHLNNFSIRNKVIIYTDSITEEFLDDFIVYLEKQDLRQSYINCLITLVKAMVKKAGIYGYAVNPSWDLVTVKNEECFSVYLSIIEITRIYYYEGLTRFQERVRDLFIVGCFTALRFSDYSNLKKEDFRNGMIVKITKKTKRKVMIPIHEVVQEIYDKYNGELPTEISNQYFNRAIKLICKKIGFTKPITSSFTKGGVIQTVTKPKWEYISSHTARRSMATNMKLTGRISTSEIMSTTGHTTEKSLNKYLKITNEDTANHLKADNFFRM